MRCVGDPCLAILHVPAGDGLLRLLQELALAERLERELVAGTCDFDDIVVPVAERQA